MLLNTSCRVMKRSLGPPRTISLLGMPLAMELATAAGRTAKPAIRAMMVSEVTIIREFLVRLSSLLRYEP